MNSGRQECTFSWTSVSLRCLMAAAPSSRTSTPQQTRSTARRDWRSPPMDMLWLLIRATTASKSTDIYNSPFIIRVDMLSLCTVRRDWKILHSSFFQPHFLVVVPSVWLLLIFDPPCLKTRVHFVRMKLDFWHSQKPAAGSSWCFNSNSKILC